MSPVTVDDGAGTSSLVGDLLSTGLGLAETHISWVFLGEKEVWKVKKPVNYGFLDYGSLDKRKRACEAEVELNRIFSPDVYLGITPIGKDSRGRFGLDGPGKPVEWAVHMVRLPESDRADQRLEAGRLPIAWLKRLAERLAAFHAAANEIALAARFGSYDALAVNLEDNVVQSRSCIIGLLGADFAAELEAGLKRSLLDRSGIIRKRAEAGKIRDGHGDLRLGQIYFDDDGRCHVLDRIEFNDRFRYGDVCSDISFLSMDLAFRGRRDLAENFLAAYARSSGDYDLYALIEYFEAYRACVRGKVACISASAPGASARESAMAQKEARRYFLFANSVLAGRKRPAPVIALGGRIASGKSTLAERVGESLGAPVIGSDLTRKQMAGLPPLESGRDGFFQGLYAPENTERVYSEMLRRARMVWETGRPVVMDATFGAAFHRKTLKSAALAAGCPFLFIECRTEEDVCRERLRRRALLPGISDAREAIFDGLQSKCEPITDEFPSEEHLVLDTGRPLGISLDESLEAIGRRWKA